MAIFKSRDDDVISAMLMRLAFPNGILMGNSLHVYVVVKVMEEAISACSNFVERAIQKC